MDLRTAFCNAPVEAVSIRPGFASALGIAGRRPDIVLRFGRGLRLARSLRRPVEAVLAPA